MAVKKFIIVGGQSNGLAIGDAQSWETANDRIAFRSPTNEDTELPQFSQGSYDDMFTMPQTFPGGPQNGLLGDTTNGNWQSFSIRGKALRFVRFLTFYNATPSFLSWDGYANTYPGSGTISSSSTPTRLNTNVQNQPVRTPVTLTSVTVADPGVFTKVGHGYTGGETIAFTSTATNGLPGGLSADASYKVIYIDPDTFTVGEWPKAPATSIEITSVGSGTINMHRAERGTITRTRTGTTHTAACGGPGGLATTNGTYVLNIDPPMLNPPPEFGETFDYELRSGTTTGTGLTIRLDTRFGGLHDLGSTATPCRISKPVGAHPARFTTVGVPFYPGRPVQLAPSSAFAIGSVPTSTDTGTEVITFAAGHTFANNDTVQMLTGLGGSIAGLSAGVTYHVIDVSGNDLSLSATQGGVAVDITGAVVGVPIITKDTPATGCAATAVNTGVITCAAGHSWTNGDPVQLDDSYGDIPDLTPGTTYYVISVVGDDFSVSTEVGGLAVTLTTPMTGIPIIRAALPGPLLEATNYYVARLADTDNVEFTASSSTVLTATDKLDLGTDYEWMQDERVTVTTTDTMPSGIVTGQLYYVQLMAATDEIQLSDQIGGTPTTISSTGSGTLTLKRLDLRTTWFLTTEPGGDEIEIVTGGGAAAGTAAMQPVFNGCLSGTTIRCTSGSVVADGKRYLKHVNYDATNDISTLHVSEAFSSAPVADDVFVIEPPDMPSALGEAEESIDFKDWGLWLPACPFEGMADGTWPMNTVTFDIDDEKGIKVTGLVRPTVGAVFKLYGEGRLPDPLQQGVRYFIHEVDEDDNAWIAQGPTATTWQSPVYKSVSSVASDVITFTGGHKYGHREAIKFRGDDCAAIGVVEGTTYYVNRISGTTIQLYSELDPDVDFALTDAATASVTSVLADSGAFYAMSVEQQGKYNPNPPGFNYPNHHNIPELYQPFAGPMRTGMEPKQGMATRLAQRMGEYLGEEIYVQQSAIGGTALTSREVTPLSGESQLGGFMWFDFRKMLTWSTGARNQCFDRFVDELRAAKRAAAVEGDSLECQGVFWPQGESDAFWEDSAASYGVNLDTLKAAIRAKIKGLGLFSGPAEAIRWIQPFIDNREGETTGWQFGPEVNAGITASADTDPFMRTVDVSDATYMPDGIHRDGVSMSTKADRCFDAWKALERAGMTKLQLCNVALTNLGDSGTVTSVDPPDASLQARLCSQHWDMALSEALRRHDWDFASRLISPTAITTDRTTWLYSYALPAGFAGVVSVLPKGSIDDESLNGTRLSVPYAIETDGNNDKRLYTNEPEALLRYTAKITDPSQWSDAFNSAVTWMLSSKIAPGLIKGSAGMEAARNALQMFEHILAGSTGYDSGTTREKHGEDDTPSFLDV